MKSLKISKQDIKASFSKAAGTYDAHAHIQQVANELLLKKLPQMPFKTILELGCGTGGLTRKLHERIKPEWIVAVDIAPNMLLMAQRGFKGLREVEFICCDAENLPIGADQRFDLIVSASTMQWFSHFGQSIEKIATNHLQKGGFFHASLFGGNSLGELSKALSLAFPERDTTMPPAIFPDPLRKFEVLTSIFSDLYIGKRLIQRQYKDILELLRILKMTGVSPRKSRRPALLSSPRGLERLQRCYLEQFGAIRASFEIILMSGKRK